MNSETVALSKDVVARAWAYVRQDIEASDPDVAQKRVPFLSRLYRAINKTFATLNEKVEAGRIDPFADLVSTRYGPEIQDVAFHTLDRPIRVGFFPVAGNPLWWGHILVALMAQAALDLDTVVLRVQGEIRYKNLPETDRVPVKNRHEIMKNILRQFYPLLRYTDLGSEPNNEQEGADEMHRYLALNRDKELHIHYLLGVESQERVVKYFKQQYEAAKRHGLDAHPNHQLTIGWIQRGAYGSQVTDADMAAFSVQAQQAAHYCHTIHSMLVQDQHIDLQVSSTYYRNTHDVAIVPRIIDQHAKAHGFYGHPPIDPRTGKPYDYTEEEHFRIKLRPVAEGIANQVVRLAERNGGRETMVLGIDGPSGSGKTTIGQEVAKYLQLRGYACVHIPFDIFLREKSWRCAMEKRILGQPLSGGEETLLGSAFEHTRPTQAYYDEECFWDAWSREVLVQRIDAFRRSGQERQVLTVHNGYNRLTKEMQDFTFELQKGMVIIIDGKYCNREDLAPHYDLRYRLYDNPDRTKAKFEMRTRTLSPSTADNQMRFYDVGLVPSFQAYAERTQEAIDWIIDLYNGDWELVKASLSTEVDWLSMLTLPQVLETRSP
jgi:uridine kinase